MRPGELEGDLEFLMRAAQKVNTIREDLMGKVGQVIADQVEEAMLGRRSRLDTEVTERESEPIRRLLKFERRVKAMKGSWRLCLEGVWHPHTKEQRSVVFDPELWKGRDDIVLVHLNHRLVQMCLRLLRAEVWSREGNKICIVSRHK